MKPEEMGNRLLIENFSLWLRTIKPAHFPLRLDNDPVESITMFGVELLRRLEDGERDTIALKIAANILFTLMGSCPNIGGPHPCDFDNDFIPNRDCPCWLDALRNQAGEEES